MMDPLSFSKNVYVGLGLVVLLIQILDRDKIKTDGRIIIYTRTPFMSVKHIIFTVLISFKNLSEK